MAPTIYNKYLRVHDKKEKYHTIRDKVSGKITVFKHDHATEILDIAIGMANGTLPLDTPRPRSYDAFARGVNGDLACAYKMLEFAASGRCTNFGARPFPSAEALLGTVEDASNTKRVSFGTVEEIGGTHQGPAKVRARDEGVVAGPTLGPRDARKAELLLSERDNLLAKVRKCDRRLEKLTSIPGYSPILPSILPPPSVTEADWRIVRRPELSVPCALEARAPPVRTDTPYPHVGGLAHTTYPAVFAGSITLQNPSPHRLPVPFEETTFLASGGPTIEERGEKVRDDDGYIIVPTPAGSGIATVADDADSVMAVAGSPIPGLDLANGIEGVEDLYSDLDSEDLYGPSVDL